jgi:hypothetical protein
MTWVLIVEEGNAPPKRSLHNHGTPTPAEMLHSLMRNPVFERIPPLKRAILMQRAEHDPAGVKLEGVNSAGVHYAYWFEEA